MMNIIGMHEQYISTLYREKLPSVLKSVTNTPGIPVHAQRMNMFLVRLRRMTINSKSRK